MKSSKSLFQILIILSVLVILISSKFKINPNDRMFKDENNRSIIFHGVNIVVKLPPYLPTEDKFDPFFSLNSIDIKIMKNFGFNLVRLGVMWESVETSEGVYNFDFLEKTRKIIDLLGENGIYTIIDIHQDLFSRIFCGEGVPVFYARNLPYEKTCTNNLITRVAELIGLCKPLSKLNWEYDENGLPVVEKCRKDFLNINTAPELTSIYESFWQNKLNIQDKFVGFLTIVMKFFKGNNYIIGLNPWNEPMEGNLFSHLSNIIPGYADKYILGPFYRKIYEKLKEIDNDIIYLLEPFPFPNTIPLFGGIFLKSFDEAPLGIENKQNQAFNFHSYCCLASPTTCLNKEPSLEDAKTTCKSYHTRKLSVNKSIGDKLGLPTIVTEFGACSSSENCYWELKNFLDAAEDHLISWAYWMYKPFGDFTTSADSNEEGLFYPDGRVQEIKERALTRTYVLAYPGTPISSKFYENGFYTTTFLYDNSLSVPLVLYLNKNYFYKNFEEKFILELLDENSQKISFKILEKENEENYISISIDNNEELNLNKLTLSIFPKTEIIKEYNENIKNIVFDLKVENNDMKQKGNVIKFVNLNRELLQLNFSVEFNDVSKNRSFSNNLKNNEFIVKEKDFITNITVDLKNGQILKLNNLNRSNILVSIN